MHILMFVVIGIASLAVMHYGPRIAGMSYDSTRYFIWGGSQSPF